jgi:hypothetical protein
MAIAQLPHITASDRIPANGFNYTLHTLRVSSVLLRGLVRIAHWLTRIQRSLIGGTKAVKAVLIQLRQVVREVRATLNGRNRRLANGVVYCAGGCRSFSTT